MGVSSAQEPRGGLIDLQPPRGTPQRLPVHFLLRLSVPEYSLTSHLDSALASSRALLWFASGSSVESSSLQALACNHAVSL